MNIGTAHRAVDDQGIGLIEIVVSMLILAALSLSLLPLLINGTRQSARTAAIASASQLVSGQIVLARAQTKTCAAVIATPTVSVGAASIYRDVPLQMRVAAGTCPIPAPTSAAPGTISYTATVVRSDTGEVLSTATTLIYVAGP